MTGGVALSATEREKEENGSGGGKKRAVGCVRPWAGNCPRGPFLPSLFFSLFFSGFYLKHFCKETLLDSNQVVVFVKFSFCHPNIQGRFDLKEQSN
jgi:hypothetical protein